MCNLDGLPMGELSNETVQEYFNDPQNDGQEREGRMDCDCYVCVGEKEGYCERTDYHCTPYVTYLFALEMANMHLRDAHLEQDAIWNRLGNSPKGYGMGGATYDALHNRYSIEEGQQMLAYEPESSNGPSIQRLRNHSSRMRKYHDMACDISRKNKFTEEDKIFAIDQWVARWGSDSVKLHFD
jgi:hypothetical protein